MILLAHSVDLPGSFSSSYPQALSALLICPADSLTIYVTFFWLQECSLFFGVGQMGWTETSFLTHLVSSSEVIFMGSRAESASFGYSLEPGFSADSFPFLTDLWSFKA